MAKKTSSAAKSASPTKPAEPDPTMLPPSRPMDPNGFVLRLLALVFLSILIYIPNMDAGWIWDDDQLITRNPAIQRGTGFLDSESWKGLGEFWYPTDETVTSDYFPLTSTTFWIEWRLWGNNEKGTPPQFHKLGAPGYHITNILLHALCAVLLWRVLERLRIPGAWVAALIWAVHPVCVESVAWVSERKNTLSMVFYLLTFLSWIKWRQIKVRKYYYHSLLWFLCALLAKTSVVPLPVVLLMIVWWHSGKITRNDIKETAPYFVMAFILGLVTVYFQMFRAVGGEFIPIGTPLERVFRASFALGFYAYKCLLPFNLILIYPQWHEAKEVAQQAYVPPYLQIIPGIVTIALFAWAWVKRATWGRHFILGAGSFVVTLIPVLGFLKMSYMRLTLVADHFQYLSMPGLIALVVGASVYFASKYGQTVRIAAGAVAAAVILLFSYLSYDLSKIYDGMFTLWTDTLKKNPNTWQANNHMGALLFRYGKTEQALYHFLRGVELKPYNCEVHNNAGLAYSSLGNTEKALYHYGEAVRIKEDDPSIRTNYANALLNAGKLDEALVHYRAALENIQKAMGRIPLHQNRSALPIYINMSAAQLQLGRFYEAAEACRQALRVDPNSQEAKRNLQIAESRLRGAVKRPSDQPAR